MSDVASMRTASAKTIQKLQEDLAAMRTSRANPELLERVVIQAYGSSMKLIELATITVPEPKVIVVEPWDKSILKDIEKGIASHTSLSPVIQGDKIRVALPPLTDERKKELGRTLSLMLESARQNVRHEREEILKNLKAQKVNGELSQDRYFQAEKEIQKVIDDTNDQIKALGGQKEQELIIT